MPIYRIYAVLGIFFRLRNPILYPHQHVAMMEKRENLSWVSVRLKPDVFARLKEESRSLGVSMSHLIRMKLSAETIKIIDTKGILNAIDKVVAEQARVNNNINQLAKHANTYRDKISPEIFLNHTIQMAKHLEHRDFMNKFLKQIYQAIK
jgi:hypothetical protein